MNTKLYTGNGGTQSITGVGFQPDWTWLKNRSTSQDSELYDAVRGATYAVHSNASSDQSSYANGLNAFGTDGFTVGDRGNINGSGNNICSWNWKAGGGQGSSNTDGSINTTYTSVNTTAGFSVSQYTGNQTSGASVGHGLGVAPKMILVKSLSEGHNWRVYHKSVGATKEFYLDTTAVPYTATNIWNDQEPTSSVFYLGNNDTGTNKSGVTYVAYCFAEKTGFSKFGSYIGTGNVDGTFCYTGFKPAWVMIKCSSAANDEWFIWDSKRLGYNGGNNNFFADTQDVESTATASGFDMLSNGFKLRTTDTALNGSGRTYIYMAFAEAPLVGSNNVPATAR
jgi:hypothetical protein